jgi:uncharacterized membrane protein
VISERTARTHLGNILLTMIVSLEAIFLSTFVMISQNRADARRQVIANEQWTTVQEKDQQNRQLLHISTQVLQLTRDVHAYAQAAAGENGSVASAQSGHSAADAGRASSARRTPARQQSGGPGRGSDGTAKAVTLTIAANTQPTVAARRVG